MQIIYKKLPTYIPKEIWQIIESYYYNDKKLHIFGEIGKEIKYLVKNNNFNISSINYKTSQLCTEKWVSQCHHCLKLFNYWKAEQRYYYNSHKREKAFERNLCFKCVL